MNQSTAALEGIREKALPVALADFNHTPIWREFLSGMRLAIRRCKHGKTGLDAVAANNVQILHNVLEDQQNYCHAIYNIQHGFKESYQLIEDENIAASVEKLDNGNQFSAFPNGETLMIMVIQGKVEVSQHASDKIGQGEVVVVNRNNPLQNLRCAEQNTVILMVSVGTQKH